MTGVNLALPKGSVIAGRITDEFGEPVAQAQVSAQRYQYGPDGQRRLQPSGIPVTTDDLGQFRLHSLMPGEYVVSASFRNMFVAPFGTAGGDTSEGFLPTFHPGTVNATEAQPVTVTLGQESHVQFALSAARMARVSGVVVDSTGRALANGIVMLMPSSGIVSGMLTTAQITTDGAFSVSNVAPGDYVMNVQPMGAFAATDRSPETAAVPLSVGGADINGIRVVTSAGTLLSGRVEFEGAASRTTPLPWRVFAQPNAPGPAAFGVGLGAANGTGAEDGAFQLQVETAAAMLLRVAGSPVWALKAVLLALPVKSTALPPGSTCGNRCVTSPSTRDSNGVGVPPAEDTCIKLPNWFGRNPIVPSSAQAAPRAFGASQSVTAGPPAVAIFLSLPSAKNAIHWPSGEKNGPMALSVPGKGVASSWLSRRT